MDKYSFKKKTKITFITAFFSPDRNQYKSTEFYFEMFEKMLSTRINVVLYLDNKYIDKGKELISRYSNLDVIYNSFEKLKEEVLDHRYNIKESRLTSFPCGKEEDFILPGNRNFSKDTLDYYYIQLSKLYHLDLYSKTTKKNESHIAWIDFGIFYLFKDVVYATNVLKTISRLIIPKGVILAPGCRDWDITMHYDYYKDRLFDNIVWFFCGSFLIGDINMFNRLYDKQKTIFIENLPKITWEVNYWSMIYNSYSSDNSSDDKFIVYGNNEHNESMLYRLVNYFYK